MAERTNVAIQQRIEDEYTERSTVAIRQDIAAKRDSISETVDKLGERIHETFDWREYVAGYPAVSLGLAAVGGLLVAGILKRRATPQERIREAVAELTEDITDRVGDVIAGVIQRKRISGRTVKAAATAMIARAVVDIAKNRISSAMSDENSGLRNSTAALSASLGNPDINVNNSSAAGRGGSTI